MRNQKIASTFLYIILLVNIALVLGIVVFNSSFILSNDLTIGNNQEEIFSNIYNKGHIAIDATRKFNSNSEGNLDGISCPTNVVFEYDALDGSGALIRETTAPISTEINYNYGVIFCGGDYNGEEFRLFLDRDTSTFTEVYYDNTLMNLVSGSGASASTDIDYSLNLATGASFTLTTPDPWWWGATLSNLNDLTENQYQGYWYYPEIIIDLGAEYNIGVIQFWNTLNTIYDSYLSNTVMELYDESITFLGSTTLGNTDNLTNVDRDLNFLGAENNIRYIRLQDYQPFVLREIAIYGSIPSIYAWQGETNFSDANNSAIFFTEDGLGGNDGIDDDFNNDDYRSGSGDIPYPNGYQDDDTTVRKTFFGTIVPHIGYTNIFWNNYKTAEVINNNTNNDDALNAKLPDVSDAVVFLGLYSADVQDFDLKILEFDPDKYEHEFTLLPLATYEGTGLSSFDGYIQSGPGNNLSISKTLTGNEFVFDFQNKNYAIFLANHANDELAYKIQAYQVDGGQTGTGIFIQPIDDSGTDIKVLTNHIISGQERNFVGGHLEIIGDKP